MTDPTKKGSDEQEPVASGTLFLTFLVLVVMGGVWITIYRLLLNR